MTFPVNPSNKKILYYHIPKSAGTALFEAFRKYFGETNVVQFPNGTNFTDEKIKEYRDVKVLGGHFRGFIEARQLIEDRYSILILRDPVQRFLSQYFYYKYTTPDGGGDKSVKLSKEKTLEEFVAYYEQLEPKVDSFRNRQVFHLKDKIGFSASPEKMLAQAKTNLSKFNLVGIYEQLDECINVLKKDIGLDETFILPRANVTKNKEEIEESLKARIRKLNHLDMELYEQAVQIVNARVQKAQEPAESDPVTAPDPVNSSIKTIYLHVGMPKTATTSIQEALRSNIGLLNKNSIHFPIKVRHQRFLVDSIHQHPEKLPANMLRGKSIEDIKNETQLRMNMFFDELAGCKQETVVISSEALISFPLDNLIRLKKFLQALMPAAQLKIIVSTRDFIDFSASILQQLTKDENPGLANFFTNRVNYLDHTQRFNNLIEAFGKENITAYKFEDALKHPFGPVGYFLELIGVDRQDIGQFETIKKNEGVSDKAIDLLSYINSVCPRYRDGKVTEGRVADDTKPLQKIKGEKFRLDKESLEKIRVVTDREKEFVKKEFGLDYISGQKDYKPSRELTFDQNYRDDLVSIYPQLSNTIKQLVYDYIVLKKKNVRDKASKNTLAEIQKWIEANHPGLQITRHWYDKFFQR